MTTVPHDEMVWRGDLGANDIHVIHSNTVLWYFAASPFYDSTSNNAIIYAQAASNANMFYLLQTREALEARLKTMSGLEFIVAQEPSETGPGVGTGVWVIRKQTRRKRMGMDDEITVHAAYFIIGESVYMAPSVADLMNSRVATISLAISKAIKAADNIQKWSPSQGRVYHNSLPSDLTRQKGLESKEATPMPGSTAHSATATGSHTDAHKTALESRLAEQSAAVFDKYGEEFMDENPITGQPGNFHLSSTGRKDKLSVPVGGKGAPLSLKDTTLPPLDTKSTATNPLARPAKDTKNPRTGAPKPRRRKSKGGTATPTTSTPNAATPS